MRRAITRDAKLENLKDAKEIERRRKVDRVLFFKFAFPDDQKAAASQDLHDYMDM